jgi:hypothetical protein
MLLLLGACTQKKIVIGVLSDDNPTSLFIKSINTNPTDVLAEFLNNFKGKIYNRYLSKLDRMEKLFNDKKDFYLEFLVLLVVIDILAKEVQEK